MAQAPSVTVKVEGARQMRAALKKSGADMKDLTSVHRDVGQVVMQAARVPVRTGKLAGSLKSSPTRTKARVTSRLPYAAPIHWGSPKRNLAPQPFISHAAVGTEDTWVELYRKRMDELMANIERST
jgi:hypothetical protein